MASGTQQSAQPSTTTDEDEVRECCSLVFDIIETGIHDLQHSGVVEAEGDLHRLDEMVQLTLAISPHVEGGSSLLHSMIDVRQAVIEEVEAMNVVQLGRPQIPIQESQLTQQKRDGYFNLTMVTSVAFE